MLYFLIKYTKNYLFVHNYTKKVLTIFKTIFKNTPYLYSLQIILLENQTVTNFLFLLVKLAKK